MRTHDGYPLTEEQNKAVDLSIGSSTSLKIEAYAGAGKTSTLSAIAKEKEDDKGFYLAYNKAIATEASEKFPTNTQCRTAHSLAYREVGFKFKSRLSRLSGKALAEHLGIEKKAFDLTPAMQGNMILDSIGNFCYSAETEISSKHAPWGTLRAIEDKQVRQMIVHHLTPYAIKTWLHMTNPKKDLPITHDVYLKLWAMGNPVIEADFILFDEAQDANPLMLDIIGKQKGQKIYVGDRYQQIYSWRGAVNAMQELNTDAACKISQSFRFGQPIADVANKILNNHLKAGVNIRGFDQIESQIRACSDPVAMLFRTNAKMIQNLIKLIDRNKLVCVAGGVWNMISLIEGMKTIMDGKRTTQNDLALFTSWDELNLYSESDSGADLAPVIKLVEDYGSDYLVRILKKSNYVKERDADIILSTAHKSKGREWKSVVLSDDFRKPSSKQYTEEESNLLYVAATRAKNIMDITDCEAVEALPVPPEELKD